MSETKNMFEKFDKKQKELEQELVKLNDEMLELSDDSLAVSEEIIRLDHRLIEYEDLILEKILDMPVNYSNEQSIKLAHRKNLRGSQDFIKIRDKILERKKTLMKNKHLILHKEYLFQLKMALLSRISF